MKAINFILFIICILVISCRQEVAVTAILDAEEGNFTYSAEGSTRLLIMDIPIGTVTSKYKRAVEKLKKELKEVE